MQRLFPKFSIIAILIVLSKCPLLGQSQVGPPGERKISCTATNIRIKDFFEIVWQQARLQAFYNDEELNSFERISVNFRRTPLDTALAELVGQRGFEWQYREGAFLIIPRKIDSLTSLTSEATKSVYGTVVDENQKPIHGVSVLCESVSTSTDIQGKFLLDKVKKGAVLQLRKVGYKPRFLFSYTDTLKIQLTTFIAPLKQVDVSGIRQRQLTASVKTIRQEDLDDEPVNNVLSALQGRVPGLYINQTTGLPGGGYQIRLRGKNSIESACDPLIVVDGIPFPSVSFNDNFINMVANGTALGANNAASPLNLLSVNDIASIDILKDAAATAPYGSRGTNGVIVIHSKQAKENEHCRTINVYSGIGKASRFIKYLDMEQYIRMRKEALRNDAVSLDLDEYDLTAWDTSTYKDWQKELIGSTASITEANIEIKEGNARIGGRGSAMYRRESTVYPDTKFRYIKFGWMGQGYYRSKDKKFSADLSLSFIADKNRLPMQDLTYYVTLPPSTPRTSSSSMSDNQLSFIPEDPDDYLLREYLAVSRNLRPTLALRYEPVKGMSFEANLGSNTLHLDEIQIVPEESYGLQLKRPKGNSTFNYNMYQNTLLNLRGAWERDFGKIRVSAVAGASFQRDKQVQNTINKYEYDMGKQLTDSSATSYGTILGKLDTSFRYRSYYLQLVLRHADKYILALVANRDKSTRLSESGSYGNFGTLSATWIFSRERWLKENGILSYGGIRGSYGISGNDQYARNMLHNAYVDVGDLPVYKDDPTGATFSPTHTWERIRKSELALDLGFKDDKYLFTFCYYNNRSTNQLLTGRYKVLSLNLPDRMKAFQYEYAYAPVNLPAVVSNTGFEIDVEATPIKKKYFSWSASFNISFPRNKLRSFPGIKNSTYKYFYQEGLSVDMLQNYHMTGIDPDSGSYTFIGSPITRDLTTGPKLEDKVYGKELGPVFYGGLQHNISFHGLELSMLIRFAKQRNYDYLYAFGYRAPGLMVNQPLSVLERWQGKGDVTTMQRFTGDEASSTARAYTFALSGDQRIIETSFVRLQSLSLGYYLPEKVLRSIYLKSCKFYLQGYNLFTLTDYRGRDPEIIADSERYPTLRIITLGIQLSF